MRSTEIYWEGVAGGNVPLRFSLACLGFSFLFRGVQRGYFSFQKEGSEIMNADELPEDFVAEADFCLPIRGSLSDLAIVRSSIEPQRVLWQ